MMTNNTTAPTWYEGSPVQRYITEHPYAAFFGTPDPAETHACALCGTRRPVTHMVACLGDPDGWVLGDGLCFRGECGDRVR